MEHLLERVTEALGVAAPTEIQVGMHLAFMTERLTAIAHALSKLPTCFACGKHLPHSYECALCPTCERRARFCAPSTVTLT